MVSLDYALFALITVYR